MQLHQDRAGLQTRRRAGYRDEVLVFLIMDCGLTIVAEGVKALEVEFRNCRM